MKKALKIALPILGALLAAFIVMIVFFPGLPEYISVRRNNEYINRTAPVLKSSVPSDYVKYDLEYVKIYAPDGMTVDRHKLSAGDDDGISLLFIKNNAVENQKIIEEYGGETIDPWDGFEHSEADFRSYFKAVGAKYPDINYPETDVTWYVKDKLKASDCLKLRGTDMEIFKEFADAKEFSWELEDAWKISGDGFTGYVCRINNGVIVNEGTYTVTVFPDGGSGTQYYGVLKNASDETAKSILGSVSLD